MWNRVEGEWKQVSGKIQERYGYARDKAESEIRDFERRMDEPRSFRS